METKALPSAAPQWGGRPSGSVFQIILFYIISIYGYPLYIPYIFHIYNETAGRETRNAERETRSAERESRGNVERETPSASRETPRATREATSAIREGTPYANRETPCAVREGMPSV